MRTRPGTPLYVTLWSAVLAMLLAATGCGSVDGGSPEEKPMHLSALADSPRSGDHQLTMTWDGKERSYAVHTPPGWTPRKRLPLVVAMHPYPSSGRFVASLSRLSEKADKENFLVAYPDGINGGYNALSCCGNEDDVGFIGAMTKRLVQKWNADPNRVYATGISNGADMSFKLAVELRNTFAAIAPVSGAFAGPAPDDPTYRPKSPVSVITFIGGADRIHDIAVQGMRTWQKRLNCKVGPPKKLNKGITRTPAKCRDKSETVVYVIPAMGHSWPGAPTGEMADPAAGVNATDLMWKFFAAHPRKRP